MMRKLVLLAGAALLATGAPAAAQNQTRYYGVTNVDTSLQRLEQRVDLQVQTGRLGRSEAALIDRDIRAIRQLQRRYSRNGLTQWELADLQRRVDAVQARVRGGRGDGRDRRYDDGSYGDPRGSWNDRDGRWDNRDGRWDNRDGRWDNRDGGWDNRDGRWDRDGRGDDRDGRWDNRDDRWNNRDSRWDRRDDRWQDRDDRSRNDATGGYYAVPERYRYQYRDTDRHYYRYRDGYIYQFDRWTGRAVNSVWIGRQ